MSLKTFSIACVLAASVASASCKGNGGLSDTTAARVDSTMAAHTATAGAITDSTTMRSPVARDSAQRADSLRTADSTSRTKGRGTP